MEDAEYITEWPPPSPSPPAASSVAVKAHRDEEFRSGDPKRPRLGKEGNCDRAQVLRLVKSSPSIKADTLLAQWWKEMVKEGGAPLDTASVNPSTKLFHISR
jgi:hypothetical protein